MLEKINNTYRNLILLIVIILIGFISLVSLNQFFTSLINDLDKKTENLQTRMAIGEFISYDIIKLRSLFNELATTTSSKRSRELIKNEIEATIKSINKSIDVLENGGTLQREIALNIAGHLSTTKELNYNINNQEKYSLEVIDIKPKLEDLKSMITEIEMMLIDRTTFRKSNEINNFIKNSKKIRRYYKSLPAFFNRMSENIRRLLYEAELELHEVNNKIKEDKVKYTQIRLLLVFSVIVTVLILGFVIIKRVNKDSRKLHELNEELKETLKIQEKQQKSIRAILDAQANITIVSINEHIQDANNQLFKFFEQYNNLDEFKKENTCICDFFEDDIPNDDYIQNKDYGKLSWSEYILNHPEKHFKVIMKKGTKRHHFLIQINKSFVDTSSNESMAIITLNDITLEMSYQNELKDLNENLESIVQNKTKELQELNENLAIKVKEELQKSREKDKILNEQSKLVSMGEMIGNIAHQWRQPLSVISTASTGMLLKKELDMLEDHEFEKSCNVINDNAQYLSQTIDDFRDFIRGDKEKALFELTKAINSFLHLIEGTQKSNNIEIKLNLEENIKLNSYQNELTQCFINIFNNAKDALLQKDGKKLFFIDTNKDGENINIVFKDNAGGIPEDIINKIFEPYFTTKHQSQGTGLGLHMTYNIIVNGMNGTISVINKIYEFENKEYKGSEFTITLPSS